MRAFRIHAGADRHGTSFRTLVLAAAIPVGLMAFADQGRADVISDVNSQLLNIIQATSTALIDGPPNAAREIAMVDGAMYTAVTAAANAGAAVSADAAALSAAATVMNNLYGATSLYGVYQGVTGSTYSAASGIGAGFAGLPASLPTAYANAAVGPTTQQYGAVTADLAHIGAALTSLASSAAVTAGITAGANAANAMLASRTGDNGVAAMISTLNAGPPSGKQPVGVYQTPATRPPLEPGAGAVTPFVISATQQTTLTNAAPGQNPLHSQAYGMDILTTACEGGVVPPTGALLAQCQGANPLGKVFTPQTSAQATAALYWNDPGGTFQPPGHWLQIADAAAASTGIGLLHHALADALVGAAMSDAGAATWDVKFTDNVWRPITAITDCADAGTWNPAFTACQSNWNSLISTPPHPDYVAGHPAFSGAAATVLDNVFGTDAIALTVASQTYCNTGATTRDNAGNTIACTVGATSIYMLGSATDCGGNTAITDGSGKIIACAVGGRTYAINNPADCNNAGTAPPLNADYTVNTAYNASPLICPITEAFSGFQAASNGDLGSTFSRVVGGIHTSAAVLDALALGNSIGQAVSSNANIPEPAALVLFSVALVGIAAARRRIIPISAL